MCFPRQAPTALDGGVKGRPYGASRGIDHGQGKEIGKGDRARLPAGAEPLSDYSAVINWGDGSSSAGAISGPAGQVFTITGGHTYAEEGKFTVTITIHHDEAPDAVVTFMPRARSSR